MIRDSNRASLKDKLNVNERGVTASSRRCLGTNKLDMARKATLVGSDSDAHQTGKVAESNGNRER